MESQNSFVKAFGFGQVVRALRNYEDDKALTQMDKTLLRGFYIDDPWALANESEKESLKMKHNVKKANFKEFMNMLNVKQDSSIK